MSWLTGKNSADDGVTAPNTIDDREWHGLQKRAKAPAFGSREAAEQTRRGAEQYRNRKSN